MLMPKHLVFAGGGPRCLSFLGSLETLVDKGVDLDGVKHYWGNSAGALMATFLSLKVPLPKLRLVFETLDYTRFRDIDLTNIVTFGNKWGLDSGDAFFVHMKDLLETVKPGASHYTLQEVPGLHITAADLTDNKMVILDGVTFPTLKVVDALRSTTSLPFFYRPFRNPVNNHMLVDGAIGQNFPWSLLPSDKDREQALGFNFKTYDSTGEPQSLTEFIPKILHFREAAAAAAASAAAMAPSNALSATTSPSGSQSKIASGKKQHVHSPNIIVFNVRGFPAWHLGVNKEDRQELFAIGHKTTEEWLISRAASETQSSQEPSADQSTPRNLTPCSGGLSESHGFPYPLQHQAPSQGSPSLPGPVCRRWSV